MASGIKDKVVIAGMGCSTFGERWDMSSDMLMVEAFQEALADSGLEKKQIEAAWLGSALDDVNVGRVQRPLCHASIGERTDRVAAPPFIDFDSGPV